MLYFILLLLVIAFISWFYYKNFYLFQKNTNIPGPSFFKSLKVMKLGQPESVANYIQEKKLYKDFLGAWLGTKYVVYSLDPEATKFVLKDPNFQKSGFSITEKQKSHFGDNLVTKDGDDWRRLRHIINCGFTNNALSSYYPSFLELTDRAIKTIPLDRDFELTDYFSRFTLDILGKTLFNHDFGRIDGTDGKYYQAYKSFFELFSSPWSKVLMLFPLASHLPVKPIQNYFEGMETLVQFFKDIIKEHRHKMDNSVLSKLLVASDNPDLLTEKELIANIWIFFLAGHETTASSLVWGLNCLRIHKDIQEKLYEEIKTVIGVDKVPTEEELEKLVYLDAFIQEVLRLHSPVPSLATREAIQDVKYKDMIIPKGTRVGIQFHTLHTNPEYWEDPHSFNPDRFTPENRKGRNHFLHVPFSAGSRQCIGNTFSLIEQRLFLARLLQKYRVVDPKETNPFTEERFLGFGRKNNVSVRIEKRNQ